MRHAKNERSEVVRPEFQKRSGDSENARLPLPPKGGGIVSLWIHNGIPKRTIPDAKQSGIIRSKIFRGNGKSRLIKT